VTIPLAPVALTAANIIPTGFIAKWNPATGAAGYYLDISSSIGFESFLAGYSNKDVGNVTTFAVTGLSEGITYYYRVRAYNTGGTSGNSNFIPVTTGITSPDAPVAIKASGITKNGFNANWNAVSGAAGYYLDVSTNSIFENFVPGFDNKDAGNVLTSPVSGLSEGTAYYYRVRAYNAGGTSPNSNTIEAMTIPPAPVALAATDTFQTSFKANWNASEGATGYYLDVSTDNIFGSFVAGYNCKDVGIALSYNVTGVISETTYYFRLRAYNTGGASENSNVITVKTKMFSPAPPVATAASGTAQTSFNANWNASAGAEGYCLDVSTGSTFGSFVPGYNNRDVGKKLNYAVSGLAPGTPYYYRLRAYNAGGTSGNSNIIMVTTAMNTPDPPVASEATNITLTGFSANWDASEGAAGYCIDVSTSRTFTEFVTGYNNKDLGNMLTLQITSLSPGFTCYYQLRAYNTAGTSGNSNAIKVSYVNHPPVVVNRIPDQQVNAAQILMIPVSPFLGRIFDDEDQGDILIISAMKENNQALPPYIVHVNDSLIVSPMLADTGSVNIVVKATDLSGASVTDTFQICILGSVTGINEINRFPLNMKLYPNPTTGPVRIDLYNVAKEITVSIYDISGTEIYFRKFQHGENIKINLSGNSPGTYLVKMNSGDTKIVRKVILNKRR
jgi:hypothetical protein